MNLKVENICLNYGKKEVLINFSYDFSNGVYGLVGENGAGKTSCMNILAGVLNRSDGLIKVDETIVNPSSKEYLGRVGYLPQVNVFYPNFKVYEYLEYITYIKEIKDDVKDKIYEILELVKLEDKRNEMCKRLSGGMKRRLGIAQALVGNPDFLILDEPTTGVDVMERIKFRNIISSLGKEKTILYSTHTISDIGMIAKEIIFISSGKIIKAGNKKELLGTIKGKVWEVEATQLEYENIIAISGEESITNIVPFAYTYKLRYVSNHPILEKAQEVEPTVEDLYSYIIGKKCDE